MTSNKVTVSYPDDMWNPNGWTIAPPWRTITLNNYGDYCIVDDDKYDEIMAHGPWLLYDYGGKRYAKRTRRRGERGPVAVYMHRWLAEKYLPRPSRKHIIVDHKKSNGLDNRLHMIRWATPKDNRLNIYGKWWQANEYVAALERRNVIPINLLDVEREE